MDNKMRDTVLKMGAGERVETTPFPRATRRTPVRNRVRNKTYVTAHPKHKAAIKARYEERKLQNLLKNTSKNVIGSMPKDKSMGWLRKIFA